MSARESGKRRGRIVTAVLTILSVAASLSVGWVTWGEILASKAQPATSGSSGSGGSAGAGSSPTATPSPHSGGSGTVSPGPGVLPSTGGPPDAGSRGS
jgi:hypothetical protein